MPLAAHLLPCKRVGLSCHHVPLSPPSLTIFPALLQEGFRPAKYFSVDRVFRNEAIDRTHLAEFHQIEGERLHFLQ